jgi:hypothetical protein
MITSPQRSPQQQPKHVGENIVNKIHHKYWRALCWLLYVVWFRLMHGRLSTFKKPQRALFLLRHKGSALCNGNLLRLGGKAGRFLHNGAQISGIG